MPAQPTLRERILDKAAEKDLTPEAIAKAADISLPHLQAILDNDREHTPAFPYIRQQLLNLADVLDLDPQEVTSAYKREFSHRVSGLHDRLPANRYALPRRQRPLLVGAIVVAALTLIYLVWGQNVFGDPLLLVTNPPAEPQPFVVATSTLTLRGQIDPRDKLLINNQVIPVETDGSFARLYTLDPEMNFIEFRVERLLGGSSRIIREVFLDTEGTPVELLDLTSTSTLEEPSTSTESVLEEAAL